MLVVTLRNNSLIIGELSFNEFTNHFNVSKTKLCLICGNVNVHKVIGIAK